MIIIEVKPPSSYELNIVLADAMFENGAVFSAVKLAFNEIEALECDATKKETLVNIVGVFNQWHKEAKVGPTEELLLESFSDSNLEINEGSADYFAGIVCETKAETMRMLVASTQMSLLQAAYLMPLFEPETFNPKHGLTTAEMFFDIGIGDKSIAELVIAYAWSVKTESRLYLSQPKNVDERVQHLLDLKIAAEIKAKSFEQTVVFLGG